MGETTTRAEIGKLFTPVQLGEVTVRNRVVFPAMLTNFGTTEGYATDRNIAFYAARARGGVGLVVVEATAVSPEGQGWGNMLGLYKDEFIPMLAELAAAVRKAGATVFIQLAHAGRETTSRLIGGTPVAPSPIPGERYEEIPLELDEAEIERVIGDYVSAATRARKAGFQGVQFCACEGGLVEQFLNPGSNRRSDAYGGELWGRTRFVREIVMRTRKEAGPGYPILVRLSSKTERDGGLKLEEVREISRVLVETGVTAVEVGQGGDFPLSATRVQAAGGQVNRASPAWDIKQTVSAPVIDQGNLRDLEEAATVVERGYADLTALGRPLITDPAFVNKGRGGEEAIPCIYCNVCRGSSETPYMTCPSNPTVGREGRFEGLGRVSEGKKVVVIGAGLAGLHVARLAAELGFQVKVYEESNLLGGLLSLRARIPGRSDNYRIVDYLSRMLTAGGVQLKLNTRPELERILAEKPDAVFVTRRGAMLEPEAKGLSNVGPADPISVLSGETQVGDKACVMGGGILAAEVACFLAQRKKKVTLLDQPAVCRGYDRNLRQGSLRALAELDGKAYLNTGRIEINIYGEITAMVEGRTQHITTDTIVLARGFSPVDDSYDALSRTMSHFYRIGDSYESVELTDMVYRGTQAVLDLGTGARRAEQGGA